ncbi:MAG: calcium-binding protein [Cypionkella sp.]
MASFKFFEGNLGIYGYGDLANYLVTSSDGTHMTLDWNPAKGVLDPTHHAAEITLSYSGFQSYLVEDGPNAGEMRVTAGTLTEVRYSNAAGSDLLDISGISVKLPIFMDALARGDSYGAWQLLSHVGATTITGSLSAAGAGHTATGDTIDTTAGNDIVYAMSGDDFVQDRGGADSYFGGTGIDTLAYDGWNYTPWLMLHGIVVDQLMGTITGPDNAIDKVAGFENILGTFMNDTMKGNAQANQFEGGAGADYFDGRGGRDTVSYAMDAGWGGTDGIRVDLVAHTIRDGFGYIDKVYNIEAVIGTAVRDIFFDNAADNYFDGGAGNDTFHFGAGNDTAHGGSGADTFIFAGGFTDDVVDDFHVSEGDKIIISGATTFAQIHLYNILTDDGTAALVVFGNNTVMLPGVVVSDLHASDFGF